MRLKKQKNKTLPLGFIVGLFFSFSASFRCWVLLAWFPVSSTLQITSSFHRLHATLICTVHSASLTENLAIFNIKLPELMAPFPLKMKNKMLFSQTRVIGLHYSGSNIIIVTRWISYLCTHWQQYWDGAAPILLWLRCAFFLQLKTHCPTQNKQELLSKCFILCQTIEMQVRMRKKHNGI